MLPATDDLKADLEVFDLLMRMDADGMFRRKPKVTAAHVWASAAVRSEQKQIHLCVSGPASQDTVREGSPDQVSPQQPVSVRWTPIPHGTRKVDVIRIRAERAAMVKSAFAGMPYFQKVAISERVESLENLTEHIDSLYKGIWDCVNDHLGTTAESLPNFINQLGVARFGQRPVVGDPFCGGGSIPFEAARIGCNVVASDLNPVAAMLTWGALNIIGADEDPRVRLAGEHKRVAYEVDSVVTRLGVEHSSRGDRAKAYLYCLETVDPQTGWLVPMAPSWVISQNRRCVARLVPDYRNKRFDIIVEEGVSAAAMAAAEAGTVQDGHLTYRLALVEGQEPREWRIAISRLRGDGEGPAQPDGSQGNTLRLWKIGDFEPRRPRWIADAPPVMPGLSPGAWIGGDIWLERLYCIQWMNGEDIVALRSQPRSYFAAPDANDMQRERNVATIVSDSLAEWQQRGLVPDMRIEPGIETTRLLRERGWTYWHHLFPARHLLSNALIGEASGTLHNLWYSRCQTLTLSSRMNNINGTAGQGGAVKYGDVFANQALNTFLNYGVRSSALLLSSGQIDPTYYSIQGTGIVRSKPANTVSEHACLWIYDPPYADAVHYHEITEFFIAWLRKSPPSPFNEWIWDSRRPLAIQGKGDKFRTDMVAAFRAMVNGMPDNGLQVCMFTHKDAGVWADMSNIVWAAGLRVTAAWYVSTETTSEIKKGGYVQGTVLLVLRKRVGEEHGYRSDIVPEVRARVAGQVETLTGLNQNVRGGARDENLFSDADIQMAGYAAALEVLTGYTHIDGVDMTREALRPPGISHQAAGMWSRMSARTRTSSTASRMVWRMEFLPVTMRMALSATRLSVARLRGPWPRRTSDASSPMVTSRTQCRLFSTAQ